MKLMHLSDLHLGKRVNEFPMAEDQEYILKEIINLIDEEKPDGIMIAGDVYDKSVPGVEAINMFDDFLRALAKRKIQVFIISGNHDSADRVAFGSWAMENSGIHIAPVYAGKVIPQELEDEYGKLKIYMLPFLRPADVRRIYADKEILSYTDAVAAAIGDMEINTDDRNILITHQFVTGAARSESEEISVGGADNVDASVFEAFDYVALGHIHGPQNIGSEKSRIRYSGSPLKYSFSEAGQVKSLTVIDLAEKGHLKIRELPLIPEYDMKELKGEYNSLISRDFYSGMNKDDYIRITLTDEDDIPDAAAKLRIIYPRLMKLDYDNKRTRSNTQTGTAAETEKKTPLQLFAEFYEKQNNGPMNEEQRKFIENLIEKIAEDEK